MQINGFLLEKEIDWSLLTQGCAIRLDYKTAFMASRHGRLGRGDAQEISILFEGEFHKVILKNQVFSSEDYPTHKDIFQLRYGARSSFALALQRTFKEAYGYLVAIGTERGTGDHRRIQLPAALRAYMVLYRTSQVCTLRRQSHTVTGRRCQPIWLALRNVLWRINGM